MAEKIGTLVREFLKENLGNPLMSSKEKKAIKENETPDEWVQKKQETGEDYPAGVHVEKSWRKK